MSTKNKIIVKVVLTILLISVPLNFTPQLKGELEKEKKQTEREMERANKILEETKNKKKNTLLDLKVLSKKIDIQKRIIRNLQNEIKKLENEIKENLIITSSLERDLEKIKSEYAKLIVTAYKNRSSNDVRMYLFASKSFNQAYKRIKYIQQFTAYRKQQVKLINTLQKVITEKNNELVRQKEEKRKYFNDEKHAQLELKKDKYEKNSLVKKLSKREKELKMDIENKKQIAKRLEREIRKIIEEEARKNAKKNLYEKLTPEEKLISENFDKNKGRLPWPTRQGVVIDKFGEHSHPVLRNIKVRNNGIDIGTITNSEVFAIFNGDVTKVIAIPGANYTVIIRHGSFLSVYQNLGYVTVKTGDWCTTNQYIGNVFTDNKRKESVLHFEIWKELEKQDPELWLSKY